MNRKTSTLFSVGISLALIAAGIWFIHDHLAGLEFDARSRPETKNAIMANGMGVIMFVVWMILIIAAVASISGVLAGRCAENEKSDSQDPLQILKRRYARGEINKMEFESKRRDLLNS